MAATESLAARAEAMLNRLAEAQAEAASLQARTQIEVARARASRIAAGLRAARDAVPVLDECGVAAGPAYARNDAPGHGAGPDGAPDRGHVDGRWAARRDCQPDRVSVR